MGAVGLAAAAAACSRTAGVESVGFGELCGAQRPVQLLALEEGAVVGSDRRSVVRNGDGWLIGVRSELEADAAADVHDPIARVVALGPCGEDERVVASGVDIVLAPPEPDQPWFSCNERERTMAWIDPIGGAPAVTLATEECAVAWVGSEVVLSQMAAEGADLVALRFDERGSIASADVLVAGVDEWSRRTFAPDGSRAGPEPTGHLLAIANGELLDVDVGARTSTTFWSDAQGFGVGDGLVGVRPDVRSHSALVLLDPGGEVLAEHGSYGTGANHGPYFGPGTVTFTRTTVADGITYSFTLDNMLGHSMPGGLLQPVAWMSDGTRILVGRFNVLNSPQDARGLFAWRAEDPIEHNERGTFIDGPVELAWQDGSGVWALFGDALDEDPRQDLVVLDDPSLTRRIVLRNVHRPLPLPRRRWISVFIEQEESGPLLVLGEGNEELLVVDENVHMELASYQSPQDHLEPYDGDSPLFYMVTAPRRRGLWMARLELEPHD